jgi:sugar phosphate isomerase/epimerase
MKLSLYSSVAWRHPYGLMKAIEWGKQFGYQAIDCRGSSLDVPVVEFKHLNANGYDMIGPRTIDQSGINELKSAFKNNGLEISTISCYCPLTVSKGALADNSMKRVRNMIDFAARLGISWVKVIGYSEAPVNGVQQERTIAINLMCEHLKILCEYAASVNVGILVENNENCIPNNAAESLFIKEKVGAANFGLVYDVFNAVFEGNDPLHELKMLKGNMVAVHLKNANSNQGKESGSYAPKESKSYQWTMLDAGEIDYAPIVKELDQQGFLGYIVCEYANPYKGMNREFWDDFPDPLAWIANASNYLNHLLKKSN